METCLLNFISMGSMALTHVCLLWSETELIHYCRESMCQIEKKNVLGEFSGRTLRVNDIKLYETCEEFESFRCESFARDSWIR